MNSCSPAMCSLDRLVTSTFMLRRRRHNLGDHRCRCQCLLKVVQHQQHLFAGEVFLEAFDQWPPFALAYAKGLRDDRRHQMRVVHGVERHEENTILEVFDQISCHLKGQAGLSNSPWPRKREQPHLPLRRSVRMAASSLSRATSRLRCEGRLLGSELSVLSGGNSDGTPATLSW